MPFTRGATLSIYETVSENENAATLNGLTPISLPLSASQALDPYASDPTRAYLPVHVEGDGTRVVYTRVEVGGQVCRLRRVSGWSGVLCGDLPSGTSDATVTVTVDGVDITETPTVNGTVQVNETFSLSGSTQFEDLWEGVLSEEEYYDSGLTKVSAVAYVGGSSYFATVGEGGSGNGRVEVLEVVNGSGSVTSVASLAFSEVGVSVAWVGDLDRDGEPFDFLVGTASGAGTVRICTFDGSDIIAAGTMEFGSNGDSFGSGLAALWGDSYSVVLGVGARGASTNTGSVRLIELDQFMESTVLNTLNGGSTGDGFGGGVAWMGDVDNDGLDRDMAVGATGENAVYIYSLSSTWSATQIIKITPAAHVRSSALYGIAIQRLYVGSDVTIAIGGPDGATSDVDVITFPTSGASSALRATYTKNGQFGTSLASLGSNLVILQPNHATQNVQFHKINPTRTSDSTLTLFDPTFPSTTINAPTQEIPLTPNLTPLQSAVAVLGSETGASFFVTLISETEPVVAEIRVDGSRCGSVRVFQWPVYRTDRFWSLQCVGMPLVEGNNVMVDVVVELDGGTELTKTGAFRTPDVWKDVEATFRSIDEASSAAWIGGNSVTPRVVIGSESAEVVRVLDGESEVASLGMDGAVSAVVGVGDVDLDGMAEDVVAGMKGEESNRGAVWVLLVDVNTKVIRKGYRVASNTNGGPTLASGDEFGASVCWIGDVNGDGRTTDVAVGAPGDGSGALYLVSLGLNGATVLQKIASGVNGGPTLATGAQFGHVNRLGVVAEADDLTLVVAAPGESKVYLVTPNLPGTIRLRGTVTDVDGFVVGGIGDITGDGRPEFVVGAPSGYGQVVVVSTDASFSGSVLTTIDRNSKAELGLTSTANFGACVIWTGVEVLVCAPGMNRVYALTLPSTNFEVVQSFSSLVSFTAVSTYDSIDTANIYPMYLAPPAVRPVIDVGGDADATVAFVINVGQTPPTVTPTVSIDGTACDRSEVTTALDTATSHMAVLCEGFPSGTSAKRPNVSIHLSAPLRLTLYTPLLIQYTDPWIYVPPVASVLPTLTDTTLKSPEDWTAIVLAGGSSALVLYDAEASQSTEIDLGQRTTRISWASDLDGDGLANDLLALQIDDSSSSQRLAALHVSTSGSVTILHQLQSTSFGSPGLVTGDVAYIGGVNFVVGVPNRTSIYLVEFDTAQERLVASELLQETAGTEFGRAVLFLGDLEMDGSANDVLVGDPSIETLFLYSVDVSGSSTTELTTLSASTKNMAWIIAQTANFGRSLAAIGDVDHDGQWNHILVDSDEGAFVFTVSPTSFEFLSVVKRGSNRVPASFPPHSRLPSGLVDYNRTGSPLSMVFDVAAGEDVPFFWWGSHPTENVPPPKHLISNAYIVEDATGDKFAARMQGVDAYPAQFVATSPQTWTSDGSISAIVTLESPVADGFTLRKIQIGDSLCASNSTELIEVSTYEVRVDCRGVVVVRGEGDFVEVGITVWYLDGTGSSKSASSAQFPFPFRFDASMGLLPNIVAVNGVANVTELDLVFGGRVNLTLTLEEVLTRSDSSVDFAISSTGVQFSVVSLDRVTISPELEFISSVDVSVRSCLIRESSTPIAVEAMDGKLVQAHALYFFTTVALEKVSVGSFGPGNSSSTDVKLDAGGGTHVYFTMRGFPAVDDLFSEEDRLCDREWREAGYTVVGKPLSNASAAEVALWAFVGSRPCRRMWTESAGVLGCEAPAGLGEGHRAYIVILGQVLDVGADLSYSPPSAIPTVYPTTPLSVYGGSEFSAYGAPVLDGLVSEAFELVSVRFGMWNATGGTVVWRNNRAELADWKTGEGVGVNFPLVVCARDVGWNATELAESLAQEFWPHSPYKIPETICTVTTGAARISYTAPLIANVDPSINLDPFGGTTVTFEATRVGTVALLARIGVVPRVLVSGQDVEGEVRVVVDSENDVFRFVTPAADDTNALIQLDVNGARSNGLTVAISQRYIVGVSPREVLPGAISYTFFIAVIGVDSMQDVLGVEIGKVLCNKPRRTQGIMMICDNIPAPNEWASKVVQVVVRGNNGTTQRTPVQQWLRPQPPPLLRALVPNSGFPAAGGINVTLSGEGFGSRSDDLAAVEWGRMDNVGGVWTPGEATWFGSNDLQAIVPAGVGTDWCVRVRTKAQLVTQPVCFDYAAPEVTSVTPDVALAGDRETTWRVCGRDFGLDASKLELFIGGVKCGTVQRDSSDGSCYSCADLQWDVASKDSSLRPQWTASGVVAVAGGQMGDSVGGLLTLVPPPEVTGVSPQRAGPGQDIVVTATGITSEISSISRIELDGVTCRNLRWSLVGRALRCQIPSDHFVWANYTAAEGLVPYVEVTIVSSSGEKSLSTDTSRFEPLGLPARPMPSLRPEGVLAWRPLGQPRTLQVRWRFPGVDAEKVLNYPRTTAPVTSFTVQAVSEHLGFNTLEPGAVEGVEVGRDETRTLAAVAGVTDAQNDSRAWDWHETRFTVAGEGMIRVRVRSENYDGMSGWTLDVTGGAPESCVQDQYLALPSSSPSGRLTCEVCPIEAACAGLPEANVTARRGYWRLPWVEGAPQFAQCIQPDACKGWEGGLSVPLVINPDRIVSHYAYNASEDGDPIAPSVLDEWGDADTTTLLSTRAVPGLELDSTSLEGCAEWHTGVLCDTCVVGAFAAVGGACSGCGDTAWVAGRMFLICCALGIGLAFVLWQAWVSRGISTSNEVMILKIVFTHLQTIAIVGSIDLRWPRAARVYFDVVEVGASATTSGLAFECLMGESARDPLARTAVVYSAPLWLVLYAALVWGVAGLCLSARRRAVSLSVPQRRRRPLRPLTLIENVRHLSNLSTRSIAQNLPSTRSIAQNLPSTSAITRTISSRVFQRQTPAERLGTTSGPSVAPSIPGLSSSAISPLHRSSSNPLRSNSAPKPSPQTTKSDWSALLRGGKTSKPAVLASPKINFGNTSPTTTTTPTTPTPTTPHKKLPSLLRSSSTPKKLLAPPKITLNSTETLNPLVSTPTTQSQSQSQAQAPPPTLARSRSEGDTSSPSSTRLPSLRDREVMPWEHEIEEDGCIWICVRSMRHEWYKVVLGFDLQLFYEEMLVSMVVLLFLIHTPITQAALRLMTCRPVGPDGSEFNSGDSSVQLRLVMDMNYACVGSDWDRMVGMGVPVVILFSFGVPLGSMLLLRHFGEEGLGQKLTRERLGFLYLGYRRDHYYWESVVLVRKVLIAMVTVLLGPLGGGIQALTALMLVLISLVLHTWAKPYEDQSLNSLELFALIVAAVTLVCGVYVVLDTFASPMGEGVVGVIASVTIVVSNVLLFIAVASNFSHAINDRWVAVQLMLRDTLIHYFGDDIFSTGVRRARPRDIAQVPPTPPTTFQSPLHRVDVVRRLNVSRKRKDILRARPQITTE